MTKAVKPRATVEMKKTRNHGSRYSTKSPFPYFVGKKLILMHLVRDLDKSSCPGTTTKFFLKNERGEGGNGVWGGVYILTERSFSSNRPLGDQLREESGLPGQVVFSQAAAPINAKKNSISRTRAPTIVLGRMTCSVSVFKKSFVISRKYAGKK